MEYNDNYYNCMTERWNKLSFPIISKNLSKHMPIFSNGKVLDLGCGNGLYFNLLKQKDNLIYGVDISENSINLCKDIGYKELFVADATHLPFSNDTFDFIFSSEVIEHIKSYDAFLAEVLRVLKPNGTLFLTSTCYSTSLFTFLKNYTGGILVFFHEFFLYVLGFFSEKIRSQFVVKWCFQSLGGHYHGFLKNKLIKNAKKAGFVHACSSFFYAIQPLPFEAMIYIHKSINNPNGWKLPKRIIIFVFAMQINIMNPIFRFFGLFANNFFLILVKK